MLALFGFSRPSILLVFTSTLCVNTGTTQDDTKFSKETPIEVLDYELTF